MTRTASFAAFFSNICEPTAQLHAPHPGIFVFGRVHLLFWDFQFRQPVYNLHGLQTHRYYFSYKTEDILLVGGAIWVTFDTAAFVGFYAILIYHPFQVECRTCF